MIVTNNAAFQSTRPLRGATNFPALLQASTARFNPRAPCGARRSGADHAGQAYAGFNPRAPCGARLTFTRHSIVPDGFQSTRPLRGATVVRCKDCDAWKSFNPRAPCGARPGRVAPACAGGERFNPRAPCGARLTRPPQSWRYVEVSIHAPLAGRDSTAALPVSHTEGVSIHAPLAGRDPLPGFTHPGAWLFQSTRPLRGATLRQICGVQIVAVSIHAPLAGRDSTAKRMYSRFVYVSIHAPLAGRDACPRVTSNVGRCFNPRAPCGARRKAVQQRSVHGVVSIHAPLAGRDVVSPSAENKQEKFQSTRPLRGATEDGKIKNADDLFQSTRPLRGATPEHYG